MPDIMVAGNKAIESSDDFVKSISELKSLLNTKKQHLLEIDLCHDAFINYGKDPRQSIIINKEVAESWIRSKNHGVSPNPGLSTLKKKMNFDSFDKVINENKLLLETFLSILKRNLPFIIQKLPYTPTLFDRHSILLNTQFVHIAELDEPGLDLSEESVGTTSHSLCMKYDKPVCLIAPENYHIDLQKAGVAISIPIHDAKGKLIAALNMPYYCPLQDLSKEQEMFDWLISWQFSMVYKIEESLAMSNRKYQLSMENLLVDAAFSTINEGIIILNQYGKVNYCNQSAQSLLGMPLDQLDNSIFASLNAIPQIHDVFDAKSNFATAIAPIATTGKNCSIKIKAITDGKSHMKGFVVNIAEAKLGNCNNANSKNTLLAKYSLDDIIGNCDEMMKAKSLTMKIAPTTANILITGETGTGKELFAHAIHNLYRPDAPFIAINCASIPKELAESELFGYAEGSFTGASKKGRAGKLEMANGGTIFLDEIGDMPLDLQPVLLRVLEDKRIMRIGSNRYTTTDFRVISATNKNLFELVKQGLFREDLYFRIATFKITVPPLRNREKDILQLAYNFAEKYSRQLNKPVPKFDANVYNVILHYAWPGNVRQLNSAMYHAVYMSESNPITVGNLPEEITNSYGTPHSSVSSFSSDGAYTFSLIKPLKEVEIDAIKNALICCENNLGKTADLLGIGRSTLYRRIKEYSINLT